ncbi:hypothetical protein [Tsukamurella ocularis]|uniref:hypothetical protein n=1 Tax=Tsukamurella ocularis TaxID=1970234 RepID=UPI002166F507|nr:hypothetical protein [Tsukamurella ocularis]MCS3781591.1 hypothetical protein [Tsukamurella ocularis]MCS3787963.1 hypothetical protein [Tsukamurella ocularis]MCS3851258.1 hypothetical protein [Tsukamurella ocularis]
MLSRVTAALTSAAAVAVLAPAVVHAAPVPGDEATARRIACEQYAVGTATFDYRDLGPWRARLVRGTTPELAAKLAGTYDAMRELLQPLEWVSTASLSGAEIRHVGDDVWKAKCFVAVHATNVQAPQGRDVVTVYNVTLDKKRNWQITDVGGTPTGP